MISLKYRLLLYQNPCDKIAPFHCCCRIILNEQRIYACGTYMSEQLFNRLLVRNLTGVMLCTCLIIIISSFSVFYTLKLIGLATSRPLLIYKMAKPTAREEFLERTLESPTPSKCRHSLGSSRCHEIFLLHFPGKEDGVTSSKIVCVGGYIYPSFPMCHRY